jgi:hypothetical protein
VVTSNKKSLNSNWNWTDREVEYLRKWVGVLSYKRLAQDIGRGMYAVKSKAYDLKLSNRGNQKAFRDGEHPASVHHHPFFGPLLTPIGQPHLDRNQWTAFDEVRLLLFYGVVDDEQLSKVLGRTVSAMRTRRYKVLWSMAKAAHLRQQLEVSDNLRDVLDELRESGEAYLPAELKDVICKPYSAPRPVAA